MLKRHHSMIAARLFALVLCLGLSSSSFGQTLRINELKANYLAGFLDFVRWDGRVKADEATIGILGSTELAAHLRELARKKTEGRVLNIVAIQPGDDQRLDEVDILYVASGYEAQWPALFEQCKPHRILLVGEGKGFIEKGGAIQFVVKRNRLHFCIRLENVQRVGIELSSSLVELAIESP